MVGAIATLSFKAFRDRVVQLYSASAYEQALSLVAEHADQFRQHCSDLYYMRACLACRSGDAPSGLAWLQEACDQGYWYHESVLEDPNLTPLRGDSQFEDLRVVFRQRHAAAQSESQPKLKVSSPAGPPKGLVLFLHGNGGNIEDEEELAHWQPAVAAGWVVAFAQSSQVLAPGRYVWTDQSRGLAEVASHLTTLQAPENTVLAGFSAGGALAIHAVLNGSVPPTRFLAIGPAIEQESLAPLLATCRRDVHGYLVVGEQDFTCEATSEFASAMQRHNLKCRLELHPGVAHDLPPEFSAQLEDRLAFLSA